MATPQPSRSQDAVAPPGGRGRVENVTTPAPSVLNSIRSNCLRFPDAVCLRFLGAGGSLVSTLTYGELWARSGAVAQKLASPRVGLRPGDPVMLTFPIGPDFLPALLGCLRAGVVAVSTYPPNLRHPAVELPKYQRFVEDSGARVVITSASFRRAALAVAAAGYSLPAAIDTWVAADPAKRVPADTLECDVEHKGDDVAFIQYTSGSSGDPKGVVVTHRALNAAVWGARKTTVRGRRIPGPVLSWLPQFHDYGLIIAHLTPLAMNAPIVSMSPFTFMQDPEAWPQAIEKYKASIVVAPSFAYELLARRMAVSGNSYDLSSLMVADAAAEPVTKDTIAAMEATGFPEHCRCASYGLAEAVAWVSHTVSLDIDADTGLAVSGDVLESRMLGMHIVVADPDTLTALPCGETGRIYLRGPGVVPGYHGKPELTAQRFGVQLTGLSDCDAAVTTGMGWYDTQDIGVITTGNKLLVKGRASDMLIVMGRNIFPTDVEKLAEKHLGEQIRRGCSVCIQASRTTGALFMEARPGKCPTAAQLRRVREATQQQLGLNLDPMLVMRKGALPKTTSGKVRRRECRHRFFNGTLGTPVAVEGVVPGFAKDGNCIDATTAEPPASFPELLAAFGVEDMTKSLAENGVDSLRLTQLMTQAQALFDVKISPLAATYVPAAMLEHAGTGPSMPLPATVLRSSVAWRALRQPPKLSGQSKPRSHSPPTFETSAASTSKSSSSPSPPPSGATAPTNPGSDTAPTSRTSCCSRQVWLQALGCCMTLVLACLCTAPAAWVYVELQDAIIRSSTVPTDPWVTTFDGGPGLALMAAPLTWMFAFTAVVIVAKWGLIGRYKAGSHAAASGFYLRWWFVDRLMAMWETFVGVHLLGTPWLNVVYKGLGCPQVPWSAHLNRFIREVDLFHAGHHSSVSGPVHCRTVTSVGLLMQPVYVHPHAQVEEFQVVYPGQVVRHNPAADNTMDAGGLVQSEDRNSVQRAIAPFVALLSVALGVWVGSWASVAVLGIDNDATTARLVACFFTMALTTACGSIVACRVTRLSFLVDHTFALAMGFLGFWVDYTPLPTFVCRAMGANVSITTQVNKCMGVVVPSTAYLVTAGPNTFLTSSHLRPKPGRPIHIERGALVGTSAVVQPGVHIGKGAAVGALAVVRAGTHVGQDTVCVGSIPTNLDGSAANDDGVGGESKAELGTADGSGIVDTQGAQIPVMFSSRAAQSGTRVSGCTMLRTLGFHLLLRALLQWLPAVGGFLLALRVARSLEAATSHVPLGVQVPIVACAVLVVAASVLVLMYMLAIRAASPCGSLVSSNGRPLATFGVTSPRVAAAGVTACNSWMIGRYVQPFIGGSWVYNAVWAAAGCTFASIFDTVLLDTLGVGDLPLIHLGHRVVLDGCMVTGHRMERGALSVYSTHIGSDCLVQDAYVMGGERLGSGVSLLGKSKIFGFEPVRATSCGEWATLVGVPACPARLQPREEEVASSSRSRRSRLQAAVSWRSQSARGMGSPPVHTSASTRSQRWWRDLSESSRQRSPSQRGGPDNVRPATVEEVVVSVRE